LLLLLLLLLQHCTFCTPAAALAPHQGGQIMTIPVDAPTV
jgi:hypothetical protein